jgi:hypothetical protein
MMMSTNMSSLSNMLLALVTLLSCAGVATGFAGFGGSKVSVLPSTSTRLMSMAAGGAAGSDTRTFTSYVVYKGKGAMGLKVIPPTFSSSGVKARSVSRTGAILLEFAPVGASPREYDWTKKATFSLSPTECGEILAMDIAKGVDFFHDPNMGESEAGKVVKKLKLSPTADMKGMFIGIQVSDKSSPAPTTYSIPISLGELAVLRSLMQFSIPRMMGFDAVWSENPAGAYSDASAPAPPPAPIWS